MADGIRTLPSALAQLAARRAVAGPTSNPLEGILQGFQQGQALQNLPQAIQVQQEALALQQLERQLGMQVAQQRLRDLQDPQAALMRQLQQQLVLKSAEPTSGIIAAPTGLETETIAIPQALTPVQQVALEAGGVQPVVAPGIAVEPIVVSGRPTGFAQDIERAAAGTEALARAKGTTSLERQLLANAQAEFNRLSREKIATEANTSRETVAATRAAGKGAGGLSQFAIANISGKAGKAGLTQEDITQRYVTEGVTDWNRLNLDANRLIQQDVERAAKDKASNLSAAERGKATSFIAAHKDLGTLAVSLKEFKASGKEPNSWERAIGVALESPPDGVFSALYQTVIGQGLSADARELNALKARVRSAVTKANAGLSQTEREIANVTQYSPATNDNLEQTLQKAAGLEEYLRNQVEAITTDPREWLKSFETGSKVSSPVATPGINPVAPAPVSPANNDPLGLFQ